METSTLHAKVLVLKLLLALQTVPLASVLKYRTSQDTLSRDLNNLEPQLFSDDFNLLSCIPLFKAVDSHASDVEIFNALLVLLARPTIPHQSGPTTPPQSIPSFDATSEQTPLPYSGDHLADSSEHLKVIDQTLKEEVEDRLITDLPDFLVLSLNQFQSFQRLQTLYTTCAKIQRCRYIWKKLAG